MVTEKEEFHDSFSQLDEEEREIALKDYVEFEATFLEKDGLFEKIGARLKEKGYDSLTLGMFYSKEEIWIKFVLTNKEATKREQKEVKAIFKDMIIEHKLDPKAFKVKVSNDDSPDW